MALKVLFVDHTSEMGGAEHSLLDLVRHLQHIETPALDIWVATTAGGALIHYLQELQITVRLFDLDEHTKLLSREQLQSAFWQVFLRQIPELWQVRTQLQKIIREHKTDLVHTNSLKAHVFGSLAVLGTGKPIIWHLRDLVTQRGDSRRLLELLAFWVRPQIVCISEAVRADLSPFLRQFATVIANGIELEQFDHAPDAIHQIRQEFNIPTSAFLVGMVGHLIPWKGHRQLLQAAQHLRHQYPDLYYLCVGGEILQFKGQLMALRQEAQDLGINDRVIFTGIREDVRSIMPSLNLLVLPSEYEPFGRVLIEAMACGKPIVATRGGGVPEIVTDGETGFLVPIGDVAQLAQGIAHFKTNPDFAQRAGAAGRHRVEQHFTLQKTAERQTKLYTNLLQTPMDARPLKILYVDHTSEMGGAEHNLLDLVKQLKQMIPDWLKLETALATVVGGDLPRHFRPLGETHFFELSARTQFFSREQLKSLTGMLRLPLTELWNIRQRLRTILHNEHVSLVQTNSLKAHVFGSLAVWGTRTPIIWHLQDLVTQRGDNRRLLELFAFLVRPHIVCISEAVRADLSPFLRQFATVIPNGIAVNKFTGVRTTAAIRQEFNIPADAFVVGLVGHLIPWKGHRHLLQAAQTLREAHPEIYYLCVGGEILQFKGQQALLKQEAERLGVSDRVIFTGIREDIPELMQSFDLFVLPSEREPFGRVLIEAMACSKPIVATHGGGVPEIVLDGETGLLVPIGDIDRLAQGIAQFKTDRAFAQRAGQAGYQRVQQYFTLETMTKRFLELYGALS